MVRFIGGEGMSREIKFRCFYNGEMFTGLPLTEILQMAADDGDNFQIEAVSEAVFLQYTGLKDKNGIEIYEGDVIDFNDLYGEVGIVSYCRDSVRFVCSLIESGRVVSIAEDLMFGDYHVTRKVIGNIHQHPELLK